MTPNSRRVLITGGAGFLGSHITALLARDGVPVRIFDRAECPEWARTTSVEYMRGDIRDSAAVARAVDDVDAIVHAAFASPRQPATVIESVNAGGASELCRQAVRSRVRRAVLISSTIVQRAPRVHPLFPHAGITAMDTYRNSRVEAERIFMASSSDGLSTAIVRPKTFLGPGRISAFTMIFDWIRRGKPVFLLGQGTSRYQLLDIRDMAEGIRLLTASDALGVFFFGARRFGTLRDDLQSLVASAGTGSPLRSIPGPIARLGIGAVEAAGMAPLSELHSMSAWNTDSVVDISRAVQELGWVPRWSNAEALESSYKWYVQSMASTGSAPTIHALPEGHKLAGRLIELVSSVVSHK